MKLGIPKSKLDAAPAEIRSELMKFRADESERFYVLEVSLKTYAEFHEFFSAKLSSESIAKIKAFEHKPQKPLPRDKWPAWTKLVEAMRAESDTGIGDTIERVAGAAGRLFKAMFKEITGQDCGCDGRKDHFNLLYPYSPPTEQSDAGHDQPERAERPSVDLKS